MKKLTFNCLAIICSSLILYSCSQATSGKDKNQKAESVTPMILSQSMGFQDPVVHLELMYDSGSWIFPVSFTDGYGDPQQVMYPMVDTGSSNFILLGEKCNGCGDPSQDNYGFARFYANDEESFQLTKNPSNSLFTISYQQDTAGILVTGLGAYSYPGLTNRNPDFDLTCTIGMAIKDPESPGNKLTNIMGLGYQSNMSGTDSLRKNDLWAPYFDQLVSKWGSGKFNVFGLSVNKTNAWLDLGGIQMNYMPTIWLDVVPENGKYTEYFVNIDSVNFMGTTPEFMRSGQVLVDSGTDQLLVPADTYEEWVDLFANALNEISRVKATKVMQDGEYVIKVIDMSGLPDGQSAIDKVASEANFTFYGNGGSVVLPVKNYFKISDIAWQGFEALQVSFDFGKGDDNIIILGDAFMQDYYIVFDRTSDTNHRIGFYPL